MLLHGSIPACAGKPCSRRSACIARRVHPRVCGEALTARGESPSAFDERRILAACVAPPSNTGRILGRRALSPRRLARLGATPDFHDGLLTFRVREMLSKGPSPRVRGSRKSRPASARCSGSIPACAGKPSPPPRIQTDCRVHPRVCGEAMGLSLRAACGRGPSTRVRGSPRHEPRADARARSIPACAGKPVSDLRAVDLVRVHPRVCGEAWMPPPHIFAIPGPSPRVRGSRAGGRRGWEWQAEKGPFGHVKMAPLV